MFDLIMVWLGANMYWIDKNGNKFDLSIKEVEIIADRAVELDQGQLNYSPIVDLWFE